MRKKTVNIPLKSLKFLKCKLCHLSHSCQFHQRGSDYRYIIPTIWQVLHFFGTWHMLIQGPKCDHHKKNHIWLVFYSGTWKFDEARLENLMYGWIIKSLHYNMALPQVCRPHSWYSPLFLMKFVVHYYKH